MSETESLPPCGDASVQRFVRMVFGFFQIVSLVGTMLFLNLAVGKSGRQWALLHAGQRTHGVIVGFRNKTIGLGRNGSEMFVEPLVRFEPIAGGKVVQFYDTRIDGRLPSFLGLASFSKGAQVTVVYDPTHPEQRAMIDYGWLNWIQVVALTGMACGLGLFWWKLRTIRIPEQEVSGTVSE